MPSPSAKPSARPRPRPSAKRSKYVHWKPTMHIREIPLLNCENEVPEMKKEMLRHYNNLLTYTCCDTDGCDALGDQLQQAQYTCNDLFGSARHKLNPSKFVHSPDSKGNLPNTTCEQLKNRKIEIGEKSLKYERKTQNSNNNRRSKPGYNGRRTQSMGGKHRIYNRRSHKKK